MTMFLKYKKQPSWEIIILIALAVLFLDQISKFIIFKNIFFTVDIYRNYNALFDLPIDFNFILIFFIFLIIALIFRFRFVKQTFNFEKNYLKKELSSEASELSSFFKLEIIFALIFGGIISNLADRLLYGYIIDYINLFDFFVFNIADLAICFGVLLLSWKVLGK